MKNLLIIVTITYIFKIIMDYLLLYCMIDYKLYLLLLLLKYIILYILLHKCTTI